jgi:hypothetical protein
VDFLGEVRVAVEDERSSVSVGTHVLENEPVADFSAFQVRVLLSTDLIESIAGRAENSCRNTLANTLFLLNWCLDRRLQSERYGVVVIVDHIVERAVDAVIDVESLGVALAAFPTINFSSNCG